MMRLTGPDRYYAADGPSPAAVEDPSPRVNTWVDDFLCCFRVMRVLHINLFLHSFGILLKLLKIRGRYLLLTLYVVMVYWFWFTATNYINLRYSTDPADDDKSMAFRYNNLLFALQYSLVHVQGDYPISTYPHHARP